MTYKYRYAANATAQERAALRKEIDGLMSASGSSDKISDFFFHKFLADPGLSAARLQAIDYWVRGGWQSLNQALRGLLPQNQRQLLEGLVANIGGVRFPAMTFANRAIALNDALGALPDYPHATFRRASYLDYTVYSALVSPGDHLEDTGFMATSTIKGAEGAAGGGNNWGTGPRVYFKVHGTHGKSIVNFSQIGGEREVLFQTGSLFLVRATAYSGKLETFFVILQEVAALPLNAVAKNPFTGA